MIYEFSYLAPKNKRELLRIISESKNGFKLLAGGTDLLVNIRLGLIKPTTVVDIKKISGHREIISSKEGLSFGPAVTISDLIENKTVQNKYPVLVKAGSGLASIQIRNRATVIGNICNASPCADMALPLLCLDAKIKLTSIEGSRILPLRDFFAGVKRTNMGPGEYCEKIIVPVEFAGVTGGFMKLKRIKGHDIGLISVCMITRDDRLRVAIGSAAPTPLLLKEFSTNDSPSKVCLAARNSINPIDDVRCSRDYRIFMAQVYIRRLMKEVQG